MANFLKSRYYNRRSSGWVCWPRHPLYRLSRDQYYSSWEMFQPSHLPEIQIWLVSGYPRLIKSRKKNESLQHKSTRWRCEILRKWTTIASSKTWAGSATHAWTRCPRQVWPRGSLTIKHYRVMEGKPSLMTSKSPRVEVQRVHLGQTPLSLNNSISGLVC